MAYIKNLDPEAVGRTCGIVNEEGHMLAPGEHGTAVIKDAKYDVVWSIPEEPVKESIIKNWPIITGCTRVSEGCNSCPSYWEYVENAEYYRPQMHSDILPEPGRNLEPTVYSVAFGSDLFHTDVPNHFIETTFRTMNHCSWHSFEIVTKRPIKLVRFSDRVKWSDNISIGVAVETAEYKDRIDALRSIPAKTKFVSMVPLLGPMGQLDLSGIHLVVAVEETWGYKRRAKQEWLDDIERQCWEQGVLYSNHHITYKNEVLTWSER